MSLRPAEIAPVPAATAQVAAAAFPKGCPAMRMRDALGAIYDDRMFASPYPARGQPAHSPWRLALVTVLQFAEGLSDRQAADAVRGRIDWKYALGLELTDPGFDFSVLCEFRARLIVGRVEQALLDAMLAQLRERGLLKARGRQRTDSTHVLAAVRAVNRLESVGETGTVARLGVMPRWLLADADRGRLGSAARSRCRACRCRRRSGLGAAGPRGSSRRSSALRCARVVGIVVDWPIRCSDNSFRSMVIR